MHLFEKPPYSPSPSSLSLSLSIDALARLEDPGLVVAEESPPRGPPPLPTSPPSSKEADSRSGVATPPPPPLPPPRLTRSLFDGVGVGLKQLKHKRGNIDLINQDQQRMVNM